MKYLYLASAYATRRQMCEFARILEAHGFSVVSGWHYQDEDSGEDGLGPERLNDLPALGTQYALNDLADIDRSDTMIMFSHGKGRGGRHVEFGYAYAKGKTIIIVGPREHVFHCLPGVYRFDEFTDLIANIHQFAKIV